MLFRSNGVLNISKDNHQGFDERARVMGVVRNGKFSYADAAEKK